MERAKVFTQFRRVGQEIQEMSRAEGVSVEVGLPRAIMLSKYARCAALYHGMTVLLEVRQANEAMILGRPLFEESCHLQDLEEAGDRADGIILDWYRDSLRRELGLIHQAHSVGLESDLDSVLKVYEERFDKLDRFRERKGVTTGGKFRSYKDRALMDGRDQAWWAYEFSHQFVHGNEAQHSYRRRTNLEGTVEIHATSEDLSWIVDVGVFGADSLIHAYRAAAGLFSWPKPSLLEDLENELEKLSELAKVESAKD